MSDAMTKNNTTTTPNLARAAALERRRALSLNGRAALGLKKPEPSRPAARSVTATTIPLASIPESARSESTTSSVMNASGKSFSRARREAMSQGGKGALGQNKTAPAVRTSATGLSVVAAVTEEVAPKADCACKGKDRAADTERELAIETVCSLVDEEPTAVVGSLATAVRKLCQERRRALSNQGKMTEKTQKMRVSATSGLRGRAAAQARRAELCENGCTRDPARDSSGAKVEFGTTLTGNEVSGTQVERTSKVTGTETGSCRAITGTEYIGAEQYGKLCLSTPAAAPAKVNVGSTSWGQRISGIDVDRSVKVTGDESGSCKAVTGTEYLSADKFESFCATKLALAPAKVGLSITLTGKNVTGTEEGRGVAVTGDESGACNSKLTGSQYDQDSSTKSACRNGSSAPHKVGVMRTWHDQQVSGTTVEHSSKVTGDEYGGCQMISGTEYIGPEQYVAFCDKERQAASRALMTSRGAQTGMLLSGTRVDLGNKVTGTEQGESLVLSGTPYSGPHQRVSQRGANNNPHPLTRGPANAPRETEPPQIHTVQGNFSITTPARSARDSELSRITGTAYGAVGRITGPVNLAAGLVSGTPEFRYQDSVVPPVMAPVQVVDEARSRLTGDGREGGFAITGAAWRRNESVTGTEGASTRRNPTLRGEQRGALIGASQLKDRERPELAVSRITGSSGNDAKGSAITYSGGARG